MTDRYELASAIFGTKRAETDPSSLSTAIITGTAVEDSESGMVRIIPDGNVIAPDGEDNSIVLPTSPNVKSGDNVIIISTGGTATTPIVAGASGSGDRVQSAADAASQAAAQAASAASQAQQDIADFKSGADVDYAIYSYVDDEIGEFSQTVSADYLSKADAQTTYATQSQLTQTAESIEASVIQDYVSKADAQTTYATKSELSVGLDGITAEVSATYATKTEAATTGSGSGESVEVADGAGLRSLTVYGKSVQDGTPTPSSPVPIQVVGGANLIDCSKYPTRTNKGITWQGSANGITASGTSSDLSYALPNSTRSDAWVKYLAAGTYTVYAGGCAYNVYRYTGETTGAVVLGWGADARSFTLNEPTYIQVGLRIESGTTVNAVYKLTLNAGSTAMPYVPYGSLGLKVSDSSDAVMSVTPIPLNGNVLASLPDGTKDVLTVDTSGHVTVQKNVGYVMLNGSETWNKSSYVFYTYALSGLKSNGAAPNAYNSAFKAGYINAVGSTAYLGMFDLFSAANPYLRVSTDAYADTTAFKAWLATVPMQVVYQLATPTTIDLGYITMPELADGCTVQILASLTPTIDAGWYTENGEAIYAQSTRITQTEQDVTTAITGVEGLQTMVRQYGNGVLVCRTGNSVGALVNADGSFDVVSVAWSGDVPTAGTVLGRYAASGIYLGNPSDSTKPYMALDADSLDLFWSNMPILHLGINETTNTPYILSGYNPSFSASDFGGASATFGEYCRASATDSFAAGHLCQVNSGANNSAAIGNNLRVIAANQVVVGCYNDATVLGDARFVVGNGYNGSPSNAFAVWDDGSIKYKATSTRFGETSGADIAITRTYTANGFAIESTVFHATADMVVMPVQFTATSNVELGAQKVATIPAAYAPAESARCAIWCSPNWSGSNFTCGYVDVNPSGEVSVTAPSAKYWFGQIVWIRA